MLHDLNKREGNSPVKDKLKGRGKRNELNIPRKCKGVVLKYLVEYFPLLVGER